MTTPPTGIPGIATRAVEPGPADPPAAGDAGFRALLDKLERLARPAAPAEVRDADGLRQALDTAADGFISAMDLRRRLEDAFRARNP